MSLCRLCLCLCFGCGRCVKSLASRDRHSCFAFASRDVRSLLRRVSARVSRSATYSVLRLISFISGPVSICAPRSPERVRSQHLFLDASHARADACLFLFLFCRGRVGKTKRKATDTKSVEKGVKYEMRKINESWRQSLEASGMLPPADGDERIDIDIDKQQEDDGELLFPDLFAAAQVGLAH